MLCLDGADLGGVLRQPGAGRGGRGWEIGAGLSLLALAAGSTALGAPDSGRHAVAVAHAGSNSTPITVIIGPPPPPPTTTQTTTTTTPAPPPPPPAPPPPGVTTGPVPAVTPAKLHAKAVIHVTQTASCVTHVRFSFSLPAGVHLRSLSALVGARHIRRQPVPRSLIVGQLPHAHRFTVRVSVTTTTAIKLSRTVHLTRCG